MTQSSNHYQGNPLLKEHAGHSPEQRTAPQLDGLTAPAAIATLEKFMEAPKTTLLISSNWELLTDVEAKAGNHRIIGRCQIGIYADSKKGGKEEYFFHRIEVDLTEYTPVAGGIEQYFLNYMNSWLQVKQHPTLFSFENKPIAQIMTDAFPPAQFSIVYNN